VGNAAKLSLQPEEPSEDDSAKMSNELPAQLRVWIECPSCGRIEEPTCDFRLPAGEAGPMLEKVGLACERCGEPAYIYLQRTVSNVH
jgi:hypothetical protein